MKCPFVWATPFRLVKKYYYMIVKERGWYLTLMEPPSDPGRECSGWGAVGGNIEWKENGKTEFYRKKRCNYSMFHVLVRTLPLSSFSQ
jgi:hypothetical protein